LVSDVAGTTTDPVYKPMELHPIGPVVFIDTAGFDDVGRLGKMRIEKTREVVKKTDLAIMLFADDNFTKEKEWADILRSQRTPIIAVINKVDKIESVDSDKTVFKSESGRIYCFRRPELYEFFK
jgi:small GTP-binding protein